VDSAGHSFCDAPVRFRQNDGEFIAAVTRGRIRAPAMNPEGVGKAADRPVADEMSKSVVDLLQTIQVQQYERQRFLTAFGSTVSASSESMSLR
jgi:hypothetical protein